MEDEHTGMRADGVEAVHAIADADGAWVAVGRHHDSDRGTVPPAHLERREQTRAARLCDIEEISVE